MRSTFCALTLGLAVVAAGCGGSPEKADTSHLESAEAEEAAEAARARYENVGRHGPQDPEEGAK